MFSTEIIINSLLYALNQSVTSHIDVLGTSDSTKDLYLQVKELCKDWGITDAMLRNCWQFEPDVWDSCIKRFEPICFEFSSSYGIIKVAIMLNDMVFFHVPDISLSEVMNDSKLEYLDTKYDLYDLSDGLPHYACFTGFEGMPLKETERYELLYQVAQHINGSVEATSFIKELIWTDLLRSMHGCTADAAGNMPCDNGVLCDRCHNDATMLAAYSAILYSLGLTK